MKSVFIEMEKLKNLNSGLGQFNLHLGKAIAAQNKEFDLNFYVPAGMNGVFGNHQYIEHKSKHRYFSPVPKKMHLWHGTHQQSKYLPAGKNVKTILTVHDLNFLAKYQGWKKTRALRKLQALVNSMDQVVTISKYTSTVLQENINLEQKKPLVIYNGNTLEVVANARKPQWMPDKPFLFSIGIIAAKKNFHTLVAMMSKLPDLTLIIAGNNTGVYADMIRQEIKTWKQENRIILPGEITSEDRYWLYTHCEGFVFPSLAEGFGLPVVEALSVGKPVFLSTSSSLPEIGGDVAYYWQNFDFNHMAEVIEKGLTECRTNPAKAETFKNHASLFSWKRSADDYLRLYHDVL